MKAFVIVALVFPLTASPVLAGLIQVQEADEAATCELRGAGMVTPAPENGMIFPREDNCAVADSDSREVAGPESAVEIAGYSPNADR